MKKIVTLWTWFFCFLVWALTSGCAHFPVGSTLFPVDFPRLDIPEPEVPAPDEGWCEEAKPIGPGSDVECIGILTPPHKLSLLMAEGDILDQTRSVIETSYKGRQADREYAASILQARDEQLRIAKEKHPKLFGLGLGIGGGVTMGFVIGILAATGSN